MDPATIGRIERGRGRRPSPRTLEKLAATLDLPLAELTRAAGGDGVRARAAAPAALAARLRGARRRRGWSPLALALRSGVALATVRDLEAGRAVRPSPLTLARLAAALGLPLDELAPATANDAAAEDEPDA